MTDPILTGRAQHLDVPALTVDDLDEPHTATQFCVVDSLGIRYIYGDQSWVAHGDALRHQHPDGHIERREITLTYGEWMPV